MIETKLLQLKVVPNDDDGCLLDNDDDGCLFDNDDDGCLFACKNNWEEARCLLSWLYQPILGMQAQEQFGEV